MLSSMLINLSWNGNIFDTEVFFDLLLDEDRLLLCRQGPNKFDISAAFCHSSNFVGGTRRTPIHAIGCRNFFLRV